MPPTYAQRNTLLLKMGFSTYQDYLNSELWANKRIATLRRDNHKCRICSAFAFTVHHLDYSKKTLFGKSLKGLVSICEKCHNEIEFTETGEKRTLFQAVLKYKELRPKTIERKVVVRRKTRKEERKRKYKERRLKVRARKQKRYNRDLSTIQKQAKRAAQ